MFRAEINELKLAKERDRSQIAVTIDANKERILHLEYEVRRKTGQLEESVDKIYKLE